MEFKRNKIDGKNYNEIKQNKGKNKKYSAVTAQ